MVTRLPRVEAQNLQPFERRSARKRNIALTYTHQTRVKNGGELSSVSAHRLDKP